MLHGIIFAHHARGLSSDPGGDLPDEVWSYFATGTGLQELYVSPDLLKPQDWDVIASAARWARRARRCLRTAIGRAETQHVIRFTAGRLGAPNAQ